MSHVIHFWEGPTPDNPDDAAELVAAGRNGLAPSARFPEFAAALRKKYPDAHTLEAKGKDGDKAVWSDSPITGETSSPFLVLGVKTDALDRKLIHFIVKTAGEHGLHTYDVQTGELWRKDDEPPPPKRVNPERLPKPAQPLMSLHRFARVGPWNAASVGPRPEAAVDVRAQIGVEETHDALFEALARRLASWEWQRGAGSGKPLLQRTAGPARQLIRVAVSDHGHGLRRNHYHLEVAFGFEIRAVQDKLFEIHPRWRGRREKARAADGDGYADAHCDINELFGIESLEALHFSPNISSASVRIQSRGDAEWWPSLFGSWYESQAEPLLAACTDLVTLNRFLNNPYRVWNGMQLDEWELMSALALAHLAPHGDVPWENVVHTARYRAWRMAMDEALIERTIAALTPASGD